MRRCKNWDHRICSRKYQPVLRPASQSTECPGAQSASLQPQLPQRMSKVNSCSSTGFNLHRGRQQMPLLFSHWQCSWQVPTYRWQTPPKTPGVLLSWSMHSNSRVLWSKPQGKLPSLWFFGCKFFNSLSQFENLWTKETNCQLPVMGKVESVPFGRGQGDFRYV